MSIENEINAFFNLPMSMSTNTNGHTTNGNSVNSRNSLETDPGKLVCKIKIPIDDWKRFSKHASIVTSQGRKRKKLRAEFHNYLAYHAQKKGIKCWLVTNFNYLQSAPLWRGKYTCKYTKCPVSYLAVIQTDNVPDFVEVCIYRSGDPAHTIRIEHRIRRKYTYRKRKSAIPPSDDEAGKQNKTATVEEKKNDEEGDTELNENEDKEDEDHDEAFIDDDSIKEEINSTSSSNNYMVVHETSTQNQVETYSNEQNEKLNKQTKKKSSKYVDPTQWDCNEVCEFVAKIGSDEVSSLLKWHEIDGSALDYMTIDYMVSKLSLKIGPAAKIKAKFNQLKEIFLNSQAKRS